MAKYIKIPADFFDWPVIKMLKNRPDGDCVVLLYINLLCDAYKKSSKGVFPLPTSPLPMKYWKYSSCLMIFATNLKPWNKPDLSNERNAAYTFTSSGLISMTEILRGTKTGERRCLCETSSPVSNAAVWMIFKHITSNIGRITKRYGMKSQTVSRFADRAIYRHTEGAGGDNGH